jgi:GNAT superfamily N-acetyltransferase
MMTAAGESARYDAAMARSIDPAAASAVPRTATTRKTSATAIDLAAADVEIVPLTADRWDDVAALFGEGGDPKTCWCMFWRVRSRDWSFTNAAESRDGLHRLVDEARDPAPGLLAYAGTRPIGWVSVAPREDYGRLANSRVRPPIDDVPVWSIVCFVVSRSVRGQGLTTRLLDAAMDYALAHGAPGLEAYPVDAGDGRIPSALGYTGHLSTFLAAGFHVVHEIDSPQATVRRVIVRREA